mgnify:CR=1 FL=1
MSSNTELGLINYSINEKSYYNDETEKNQIYIHSSLFGINPFRLIDHYSRNASSPIKTPPMFIITSTPEHVYDNYTDGNVIQVYPSKFWSHHLHLKEAHLVNGGPGIDTISRGSISIELCNWGPLIETEHGICTTTGLYLNDNEVYEFSTPYRGHKYYNKYTDNQIDNLRKLLVLLGKKWAIDIKFKGNGIFSVDRRALMGTSGIYCHNSVRPDIADISPQTNLVEMLNSL